MGMIEMLAKKQEKRPRLSKTDGPKSHVPYGTFTRSAGRPAGREFKKHPLPTTHSLRECKNKKKAGSFFMFPIDCTLHRCLILKIDRFD